MSNNFTGITPDKKMKTIEIDRYIHQEDNPYTVKVAGQLTYAEAFEKLKSHLEYVEMLPDEYLGLHSGIDPDEHIPKDWKGFRFDTVFGTAVGAADGIYMDITIDTDHGIVNFAYGKTHKESTEDFMRMYRIAAECDLMLNGNGDIFRLPNDVYDLLKERSLTHGNISDFNFYVESYDTENHHEPTDPPFHNLDLEEAKEEFIARVSKYPDTIRTILGVDFKAHDEKFARWFSLFPFGGIELLCSAHGNRYVADDWKDTILTREVAFKGVMKDINMSLSDIEGKLVRTGLVDGNNSEEIRSASTEISREIDRHNDLEDEDLVDEDGWGL